MSKLNFVDVAKVSLWVKEAKSGKRFLSGTISFNDGSKVNISLFHNDDKRQEKSPEFWGKLSVSDDRLGETVILNDEDSGSNKRNQKPARSQHESNDFF